MARPRTPLGTYGNITTSQLDSQHRIVINSKGVRVRKPEPGENLKWRARARYRNDLGQQIHVERFRKTKSAAEIALREALKEVAQTTAKDITRDSTIEQLSKRWLEAKAKEDVTPRTLDTYRDSVRKHILAPNTGIGQLTLREATPERLQRFIDSLVNGDKGVGTARSTRRVLSGMFSYAVRIDAIQNNPTRELKSPKAIGDHTTTAYTQEAIIDMLKKLEQSDWAKQYDLPDLIAFLAGTGVRIGEVLGLLWEDVDLAKGVVKVHANIVRVKDQGLVRQPHTKSRDVRILPIPDPLIAILMARRIAGMPNTCGAVFPSSTGTFRDPSNLLKLWIDACKKLNIEHKSFHAFRKSVATTIDLAGLGARAAAEQLGHKNPALTQQVYMSKQTGDTRAAEALAKMYPPKTN